MSTSPHPPRILMLHGIFFRLCISTYTETFSGSTQSGSLFNIKTTHLEKALKKAIPGVRLLYPTAPFEEPASSNKWTWWHAESLGSEYSGLPKTFNNIVSVLDHEGPVDGIIGFSQGAAAGAMVAALLDHGRNDATSKILDSDIISELKHPPLKFLVCYSGFKASWPMYRPFYEPCIGTPSLHVIGSLDTVVEEGMSRDLADCFQHGNVYLHPGGHIVPISKREVDAVVHFVAGACSGALESREVIEDDEDVLNMDLPF